MVDRFLAGLRRLAADRGGTVLIEFAMAFPVLVLLYLGGYMLSDAIACNRKVTVTARALTDLTTRYVAVREADVQMILNASAQVLSPYDVSKATIILSEVQVTSVSQTNTQARVVWSRALNGTALPDDVSSRVTLPANMAPVNTYMIVGKVTYTYTPPVKLVGFGGSMTLTDTIVMLPRIYEQIPLS